MSHINRGFLKILKRIIAEQGESVLGDVPRLKGFIKLYAVKVPREEKTAFGRCIEAGVYGELKRARTQDERNRYMEQLVIRLGKNVEEKKRYVDVLNMIEAALFGEEKPRHKNAPVPRAERAARPTARRTARRTAKRMGKKLFVIAAAVLVVGALAVTGIRGFAGAGTDASPPPMPDAALSLANYDLAFAPIVEFHGEAFPAKILSTAAMKTGFDGKPRMIQGSAYFGDTIGDFGVQVKIKSPDGKPVPVRVEVESDRFLRKSSEVLLLPSNREAEVFPRIIYDYAALEGLREAAVENVFFRIYIEDKLKAEKSETVRFHSVNEAPFREISRADGKTVLDYSFFFAAFVNEDDPFLDKILKESLEIGVVEKLGLASGFSFSGYQDVDGDGNSFREVHLQVLSIWAYFQRHNITYSNIANTSTANQGMASQYVRTLQESFENNQANCVDGTVLFASVLRKIGIEPYLVLIPGHMFLGYDLDAAGSRREYLETTMLGAAGMGYVQPSESWDTFNAAVDFAGHTWNKERNKFRNSSGDYLLISIAQCRDMGIMPIKRR
jgi:hypothetical protein